MPQSLDSITCFDQLMQSLDRNGRVTYARSVLTQLQDDGSEPDTRGLLLDAAESLAAEQGVDVVSIRKVNVAAGRSPASVHYHFGSKEALIAAVVHRREAMIGAHRAEMLAPLEREAIPSIQRVAEAMIVPLADIRRTQPWGETYLRFLQSMTNAGTIWRMVLNDVFAPQHERMQAVLARATPDVPTPTRLFRLDAASQFSLATLANLSDHAAIWAANPVADGRVADPAATDEALRAAIDIVTAILSAPVGHGWPST